MLTAFFTVKVLFSMNFYLVARPSKKSTTKYYEYYSYLAVMKSLREAPRRKRPDSWREINGPQAKTALLHSPNCLVMTVSQSTRPHSSYELRIRQISHQQTSFVPEAETQNGRRFQPVENTQENSLAEFRDNAQKAFQQCLQN